ncbi:unnamed protein product [Chilo suppressalis]|uniref:Endonuclease-reverse transcriptase n=1 Tax=Chilo suppressalis TaxID=168631 RepID=A0ABN8BDK0_CHISP|nr:unnamed protein product [Chilo suppressalis]
MDMQMILSKIEEQFEKQTSLITDNVTKKLSATIDEKLNPLLEENQELKKEISSLKSKLQNLERDIRRNNLIMHGVKETENADVIDLVLKTLNIACEKAGIENWDKWEISDARRLGKATPNKIRPILISVTLAWRKTQMLKNKKSLPQNVYISEDYSKDVLNKRKELKIQQQEEIKQGKQAYIRYDKLIIKEKPSEKRKRSLSKSPKTPHSAESTYAAQTKICKTKKLEQMNRARSNSFSTPTANKQ